MNKKNERLLLFTIILIFIALRIAFITQKNLWFDEIFSWQLTLGSFYEIIVRTSQDIHPPLYYFILKIWNWLFGDSVFSMRILSTLVSALSLLFIYPIAKRVLSHLNSIIVIFLFTINPLNIFYSQEVRMSAMNLFLNAGSVYFLLKMLDKNQDWRIFFKKSDVYLYILFRTLAIYTHYFSFFIFAVEIVLVLFVARLKVVPRLNPTSEQSLPYGNYAKRSFRDFISRVLLRRDTAKYGVYITSFAAVFLLYLPWVQTFYAHLIRGQSWRYVQLNKSASTELLNFLKDINLGLYYHYTNLNLIYYITIFLVIVYSLSFILSFLPAFRRKQESVASYNPLIPFMLVVVPLLLGILISLRQKVEFYRYLSIIVPYILILFVYGITRIEKKFIYFPIIFLLLLVNIFGLTVQYSCDFKNDDYRSIIHLIESNHKTGDRIYVEPHYMGWSIDYYKKQNDLKLPNPVYIRYGWNEILDSIHVQKPERFWVIFDYSSVDTTKYAGYINGLMNEFIFEEKYVFILKPLRVELYRFGK